MCKYPSSIITHLYKWFGYLFLNKAEGKEEHISFACAIFILQAEKNEEDAIN